jgi:hypothetical protein
MNRTHTPAAVVAAIILTLALPGCANGKTETEPIAKPSATTSPSPAVTVTATITREAAGKQYLAISTPLNAALDRNVKKCKADNEFLSEGGESFKTSSQRLANLRACAVDLAKAWRTSIAAMRAAQWPAEALTDIEALTKLTEAEAYNFEQQAKARSEDEYISTANRQPKDDGSADLVRAHLGLPKRPVRG